jgi:uncharacterized repeat protein (TIGR01451 family)
MDSRPRRARAFRPGRSVEALESRRLLATFMVTSAADLGPGSLRQAILNADGTPGPDAIGFAIPGPGVHKIVPSQPLPAITGPVVIDGYTQPGARANTAAVGTNAVILVELDGGLLITGGGSLVRGLAINPYAGSNPTAPGMGPLGIALQGVGGNRIEGNFFGVNASGTDFVHHKSEPAPVLVTATDSSGNILGGTSPGDRNLFAGNSGGITLGGPTGSSANLIEGNLFGADRTGTALLTETNDASVKLVNGSGNTIGGTSPAARNVIAGGAIDIGDSNRTQATIHANVVQGNYIGLDATGARALGGGLVFDTGSTDDRIGGTEPGAGNVIVSGGLQFLGDGGVIQGNFIGTDATGTRALGVAGVELGGNGNLLGGTVPSARNVISGNQDNGLQVDASTTSPNIIQGNFIGTQADGVSPLGNGSAGIYVGIPLFSAVATIAPIIGGPEPGAGNTIAYNGRMGIFASVGDVSIVGNTIFANGADGVQVTGGTGVSILSNSISRNAGLGIELGSDGVTPNPPSGPPHGPNLLQNYPVLTSVALSSGGTTVTGTLDSTHDTTFTVQFFSSPFADPTGFGEGQNFLGEVSVATDYLGHADFTATLPVTVPSGQVVTATATDPAGNTSEFSRAQVSGIPGQADLSVDVSTPLPPTTPIMEGGLATFMVTVTNHGPDAATNVALVDGLPIFKDVDVLPPLPFPIVSATASQGTMTFTPGVLDTSLGTLGPGATATVKIVVLGARPATLRVTALVTSAQADPSPDDNSSDNAIPVTPGPVLDLRLVGSPTPVVQVGRNLTYIFGVVNRGDSFAREATLTVALPPGVTLVSATSSGGDNPISQPGGIVTARLVDVGLIPGSPALVTIVVRPKAPGTLVASATLRSSPTDPAPITRSLTVTARGSVPGDYGGDAKTDVALYDQTAGQFLIVQPGGAIKTIPFGNPAHRDMPVAGDYDGDGKTDLAVYDPVLAQFFIARSGGGVLTPRFGDPGHTNIPLAGDYDGDGKADLAIYDATAARFYIALSGGGAMTPTFGDPHHANIPVAGDFDGDGKTDLAIYDQTAGRFYIRESSGAALTVTLGVPGHGDIPLAGDYDGDGKTDVALYDPTTAQFLIHGSAGGVLTRQFGDPRHVNVPLVGAYSGLGLTDLAIYDRTAGRLFIALTGGGALGPVLGDPTHLNVPIPGTLVPGVTIATVSSPVARGPGVEELSARPAPGVDVRAEALADELAPVQRRERHATSVANLGQHPRRLGGAGPARRSTGPLGPDGDRSPFTSRR